jgi:zinc-finger of transposase IS204/IS1001/IS1096/IS1165
VSASATRSIPDVTLPFGWSASLSVQAGAGLHPYVDGGMKRNANISILGSRPNLNVIAAEHGELAWIVSVDSRDGEQDPDRASCPICGKQLRSRHSSYMRRLRNLSAQGRPVNVQARLTRWRCPNERCDRRIFAKRLPRPATPFARRTARLAGVVKLFGHSAGGRPSERLMVRLGSR